MSEILTVKFPFNLRKRKTVATKADNKSQSSRYRQNVRLTNPARYKQMQVKDKQRKEGKYKHVAALNPDEAIQQRQKWKHDKQVQRSANVPKDKPQKKLKLMTDDERKEYNRQKKKESRDRRNCQKKAYDKKVDRSRKQFATCTDNKNPDINCASSRATDFRRAKVIQQELPHSP